jgi:hypothetical protein
MRTVAGMCGKSQLRSLDFHGHATSWSDAALLGHCGCRLGRDELVAWTGTERQAGQCIHKSTNTNPGCCVFRVSEKCRPSFVRGIFDSGLSPHFQPSSNEDHELHDTSLRKWPKLHIHRGVSATILGNQCLLCRTTLARRQLQAAMCPCHGWGLLRLVHWL